MKDTGKHIAWWIAIVVLLDEIIIKAFFDDLNDHNKFAIRIGLALTLGLMLRFLRIKLQKKAD